MTIFGWDTSHYDWDRGPMDIAAAVADGIVFMTHKVGEGKTVTDDRFDDFWKRARAAKVPLVGAYYVNHPGDQNAQADRFLSLLNAKAPGWSDGPFLLQVDAEKFDYMTREPSPAECEAFCDRLVQKTDGRFRPVLYAPKWLYGNRLTNVTYPLWASAYGNNPATGYRSAYPGDGSSRWDAYSGQTPAILQFGSQAKIGRQSTCDANAFRGTLAQLRALVYPKGDNMSEVWDETFKSPYDGRDLPAQVFLRYANYRAYKNGEDLAEVKTAAKAILAAVTGGGDTDAILAGVRAELVASEQRLMSALQQQVGPQILAGLREELDGVEDARLVAAVEAALRQAAAAYANGAQS